MAQDKTLTCRDCGADFIFFIRTRFPMQKKVLPTNQAVALTAEQQNNKETVAMAVINNVNNAGNVQCNMRRLRQVARPKFPFPSKQRSSCILQRLFQANKR